MQGQLLDLDPAKSSIAQADFVMAAGTGPKAWNADVFGVAARQGTLYRPLMTYGGEVAASAGLSGRHLPLGSADCNAMLTGGLGGIGLMAAAWLVGRGVGGIVLLGRSGLSPAGLLSLTSSAALVTVVKCDASSSEDSLGAAHAARAHSRALSAILHAAGVQVESPMARQSPAVMRSTMAPKLAAVEALEASTVGDPLVANLLFSSISAVAGLSRQANYAAANAALDAAARARAAEGRPFAAAQFGGWATVGKRCEREHAVLFSSCFSPPYR
jgi:hypothetical protein